MTRFTSTLRFVLVLAGVSMVLAGLAGVAVGAVTLWSGSDEVRLDVSTGPEVTVPAASGVLGGSVMVYTARPAGESPRMLGCELVEADGDVASGTRLGAFDHALDDPVTVDGTTWYPFTQIELGSDPATLRCPGDLLSSAGVSQQSTFGGMTTFIGAFALGSGLLSLVLGVGALLAVRLVRR